MKISIVIVNYNVRAYLWQCIDSVRRATKNVETEVWVVDNASTDDSVKAIRHDYPTVHVIENSDNVGFARANNQAIRQSTGELILLLNPDTILAEDSIIKVCNFMDAHPTAGGVGIRMLNRNGSFARESRRGLPTPATAFYKMCGLCALLPHHPRFGHYYMGQWPEHLEGEIEVISGAFMLLRRKALNQVGLLDEDYFMYGEDIDLSYRLLHGGWQNWYVPALMLHYKGESTQKTTMRYVRTFYGAMLIFFNKHFARRYRFTSVIVEMAVVIRGSLVMCAKWMRHGMHTAVQWFSRATRLDRLMNKHLPKPETMLFFGSDSAWSEIQTICRREGMEPIRHQPNATSEVSKLSCTYYVHEINEEGTPYSTLLSHMQQRAAAGLDGNIGTYHLAKHTLILPNEIIYY